MKNAVMTNDQLSIKFHREGYGHPKCYLSPTKGCSTQISSEHYISESLLNLIEKQNRTIDVAGLFWLPKGYIKSIGKSNLVANILCVNHNSALSGLDSAASHFVKSIAEIDEENKKETPNSLSFTVDGGLIERWIVKAIVGMIVSGQVKQGDGTPFSYSGKCIKLLCSPFHRWPTDWGLYARIPTSEVHHSLSFAFIPLFNERTGEVLALDISFNGLPLFFAMGKLDTPMSVGIHRPKKINLLKRQVVSSIEFSWRDRQAVGPEFSLEHIGTYKGFAPGQDLPHAK